MRPIRSAAEVGRGNLVEKESLAPVVHALWDAWEIHSLILVSLFLQVFLFFTAGMRRHNTSWVLRTLLWLAYLSADAVAIFVLGHLAVHASAPRHELMFFWAPFVLVHLGGQDTITAFSKQDNELWTRHLLSLVTQVTLAGYVVAKASWTDAHLWAATVIMFLSGCFKYAERTLCLYLASPGWLRSDSLVALSLRLPTLLKAETPPYWWALLKWYRGPRDVNTIFNRLESSLDIISDIISIDVPRNSSMYVLDQNIALALHIPDVDSSLGPRWYKNYYGYVETCLVRCNHRLYTKIPLRQAFLEKMFDCSCHVSSFPNGILLMLYTIFLYVSTPTALVLFTVAEKASGRADVAVCYILLVGALVLDVCSVILSIYSHLRFNLPPGSIRDAMSRVANYIQPVWSQKLAQYSVVKSCATSAGVPSIRWWIGKRLSAWGIELFDITHTSITEDGTPMRQFIFKNLLDYAQIRNRWDICSSRGQLVLSRRVLNNGPENALLKSTSNNVDFPTSVLIWHIATDICYYCGSANTNSDEIKKFKQMSRKLSNYIMYLVYKCNVLLTSDSQLVHDKAHEEITEILQDQHHLSEDNAVKKLFKGKKTEEKEDLTVGHHEHNGLETDNNILARKLQQRYSPMLPRAWDVAQELVNINNEFDRWSLIAEVWTEMLYYIAPRCGGSFHYEHLSTGGEFITHVLVIMYILGPFLPTPDA